ncbi:MAG: CDC48 family AAA ATPase [Planctomycetota bacterium]
MPSDTDGPARIERRVAEAQKRDAGRGIVRLDPGDMTAMGATIGSFVRITGKRSTLCKAMPQFKEQRGQGRVQLDGVARENAGAGIDDPVVVEQASPPTAASVTIAPRNVRVTDRDLAYIGGLLDGLAVRKGDAVRATLFGSRTAEFTVEAVTPAERAADSTPAAAHEAVIHPTTELLIARGKEDAAPQAATSTPSYEDIGGLGHQVARIREMIELPLRFPQVFDTLGIDPPKGVLLHGPPGTGKTLIARTIAHEADASFFTVSGPEIVHRHYGESEKHLREIWEKATKKSPAIIFIDEIDSIAPKRDSVEGEVEKRIVAQLLALMDGLTKRANVVVIAATNLPNSIDPALRRPGRFDREIEIPIPDRHGRRQILDIHSRGMPIAPGVDLDEIAAITHGCVGADLEHLCRESAMACLRGVMDDIDLQAQSIPPEVLRSLEVSMDHFRAGFAEVEPSAIREVFVEVPSVAWSDIGGLDDIKQRLLEAVEWPLRHTDIFRDAGVRPPKGILLAGPPGVGKTMLAKAVATQTQANFISVKGPELMSKFVGDSEHRLREVFRKARQASPCIVFFDEIDALIPRRGLNQSDAVSDRVLAQFLAEVDGVEELNGVLILGATNRIDMLDPAMLRPGRFDDIIEIDAPAEDDRTHIFEVHMRGRPFADGISAAGLARIAAGASGAQIAGAVRRAAMAAVRRAVRANERGATVPLEIAEADIERAILSEISGRSDVSTDRTGTEAA